jgi:hypothetical protein
MKILLVKFYQGVRIGGISETSASPANYKIEIQDKGVTISKADRVTLISWNNVAYIEYETVPETVMQKPIKNK